MIAFIDAEFNREKHKSKEHNDKSLIEVAIIIKESILSTEVVDTYHSYVKPKRNNGILYERIKELINIKQEDVDNAPSFDEVYDELLKLKEKYNIEKIYCWGNFDAYGFSWNMRNSSEKEKDEKDKSFYHIFEDIEVSVLDYLKLPAKQSALKKMAYICDYEYERKHSALTDVKALEEIVRMIFSDNYNKRKRYEYYSYLKELSLYTELKDIISVIRKMGFDEEKIINMARNNEEFPTFSEIISKK